MKSFAVTLICVSFVCVSVRGSEVDLRGKWKEDQNLREGLSDFLYEMGMSWFKRVYVTSTSWENEQTIFQDGNNVRVNGVKGPKREVFEINLVADNSTITQTDMGELGGVRPTTAEFKDNSLISYLHSPENAKVIDILAVRTINPENPNLMVYSITHIPSGKAYVSYMYKQV